jgi:hypothetical protein
MGATGIGFMGIIGIGLLFIMGLGDRLEYRLSHELWWQYHLIIFSVCRPDIIGYTTLIFIATGGIGIVLTTGTVMIGTEIIPSIIGVVESGTHMRGSIEMPDEVGLHEKRAKDKPGGTEPSTGPSSKV